MPNNKKKKAKGKKKSKCLVPKQELDVVHVDCERLFDSLVAHIRQHNEKRDQLSARSFEEYASKGKGMFVANALDEEERIRTDMDELFNALEWWNHDDLVANKMPQYAPSDPVYDPEVHDFLMRRHDIQQSFIIALYWNHPVVGRDSNFTTLGQSNPYNLHIRVNTLPYNPYQSGQIGTTLKVKGRQCAAEGCEVMEGTIKAKCPNCPDGVCKHVLQPIRPLMECSQCQQVKYCSRECQRKDWNAGHRDVCKQLRRKLKEMQQENVANPGTA